MHIACIISHCASDPGPLIIPGVSYCITYIIPLCISSYQASYPIMHILSPPSILSHHVYLILLCILSYYTYFGHTILSSIFLKCAYPFFVHLITHFISSDMSFYRISYHSSMQHIPLCILSYYVYLIPMGILSNRAFYLTRYLIPIYILSQYVFYPIIHTTLHAYIYIIRYIDFLFVIIIPSYIKFIQDKNINMGTYFS